jgi:hypothetical protein
VLSQADLVLGMEGRRGIEGVAVEAVVAVGGRRSVDEE